MYESCSEEEEISVSEKEKIQRESELESASETPERACYDNTSADEGKEMKKSDSSGKQKLTISNSSTDAKPKKKAQSLSEEEMEELCGELEERRKDLDVKMRETIESSDNLKFYPSRAGLEKHCWEIQPHFLS